MMNKDSLMKHPENLTILRYDPTENACHYSQILLYDPFFAISTPS